MKILRGCGGVHDTWVHPFAWEEAGGRRRTGRHGRRAGLGLGEEMGGDHIKRRASEARGLESNPRKRMEKIRGWQARCCIAWTGPSENNSMVAWGLLTAKAMPCEK